MENSLKLGISSCLLGNLVRYDGQHKYDAWIVETLGKHVSYVPVCPEVECGLGVPREAMRLVGDGEVSRLVTQRTAIDHSERMLEFAESRLQELKQENLCGYILKSKSPSCGMERVKIYPEKGGASQKRGVGLYAGAFLKAFPLLPCEEEGRLHDPVLRENFIERIFVMHRWNLEVRDSARPGDLVNFHTHHKLLLMAHSPQLYRQTGKLVSDISKFPLAEFKLLYLALLAQALSYPATPSKHRNVLEHILGYFKKDLSSAEKAEMLELIADYQAHRIPLIVPVTMLNHYVRKYDKPYLADQHYLHPHPGELALRNHV